MACTADYWDHDEQMDKDQTRRLSTNKLVGALTDECRGPENAKPRQRRNKRGREIHSNQVLSPRASMLPPCHRRFTTHTRIVHISFIHPFNASFVVVVVVVIVVVVRSAGFMMHWRPGAAGWSCVALF